jgi:hypothetical protein
MPVPGALEALFDLYLARSYEGAHMVAEAVAKELVPISDPEVFSQILESHSMWLSNDSTDRILTYWEQGLESQEREPPEACRQILESLMQST